jgi:predicted DNA-binding protein with PD1-like motif
VCLRIPPQPRPPACSTCPGASQTRARCRLRSQLRARTRGSPLICLWWTGHARGANAGLHSSCLPMDARAWLPVVVTTATAQESERVLVTRVGCGCVVAAVLSYLFACQVVSVSWVRGVGNLLQDILQYWCFRLLEGEREQQRRVPRWPAKVHPPVAHVHVLVSSGDRRAVRGAHRSGNLVREPGMLSRCAGAAATPTAHKTRLDTRIIAVTVVLVV